MAKMHKSLNAVSANTLGSSVMAGSSFQPSIAKGISLWVSATNLTETSDGCYVYVEISLDGTTWNLLDSIYVGLADIRQSVVPGDAAKFAATPAFRYARARFVNGFEGVVPVVTAWLVLTDLESVA